MAMAPFGSLAAHPVMRDSRSFWSLVMASVKAAFPAMAPQA